MGHNDITPRLDGEVELGLLLNTGHDQEEGSARKKQKVDLSVDEAVAILESLRRAA